MKRIGVYFGNLMGSNAFIDVLPQGEPIYYLNLHDMQVADPSEVFIDENKTILSQSVVPVYNEEVETALSDLNREYTLYHIDPNKLEILTQKWHDLVNLTYGENKPDSEVVQAKLREFRGLAIS